MKEQFLLALDQGTTGTTALLVDHKGEIRARKTQEFPQHFPKPGWVEHNLNEIWSSVLSTISHVIQTGEIQPTQIAAIGITNQRETTCLWNRRTLEPLHPAIVWQCKRSNSICTELSAVDDNMVVVRSKTGLVIDPYFSGTKLTWAFREYPRLKAAAEDGDLCFGTIDSYLVAQLTGGKQHVTDITNASRTLLFNIHTQAWDDDLISLFEVPRQCLPRVVESSETVGKTSGLPVLPDGIPICGILGDQQAALFGQCCFDQGLAKCTYGTGAFMLVNTGAVPVPSKNQLLTTVAWKINGTITYALEGSAFIAGAAVQWLRDHLKMIETSAEIEELAREVSETGHVVFVPAFSGLGAPYWEPNAKAAILGLSRDTKPAHIARAVLEGIANQNRDILRAMEDDMDGNIKELRVDGGASANHLMMQYQADILGVPIIQPQTLETTALGAAFAAGLEVGMWNDLNSIRTIWKQQRRFDPDMPPDQVAYHLKKWRLGIQAVRALTELEKEAP